jgi:uncharacterized protein YraI
MKRLVTSIAAALFCAPLLANAAEGWVVADISLQAGPDTDYPSIAELDAGTPVSVQGCIDGWAWCDVIVGDDRGWVPGTFIEEEVGGRPVVIIEEGARIGIPVVSFSIGAYWGSHYHNRPFYTERARFESHAISGHTPPRPSSIVATAPRRDAKPRPASGSTVMQGRATQQTAPATQERTTERARTATRTPLPQQSPEQQQSRVIANPRDQAHERDAQQRQAMQQQPAPKDAAPQMTPKNERPVAERPQQEQPQQQRPAQQVARAAAPKDEHATDKHEPKPKDELKKADNKKKDNSDNGGG